MDIAFLILILITGALTIYTDLREGCIKNIHLVTVASLAIVLYVIFFFRGTLPASPALIVSPLIGLLIGFFLYASGLWKAGDAKLFFTYSLLLPDNKYQEMLPLACLPLFLSIFLISFLFILPSSIAVSLKQKDKILSKKGLGKTGQKFIKTFLIVVGIFWIAQPLLSLLPLGDNVFLHFTVLYVGYLFLHRSLGKIGYHYIAIPACILLGSLLRYYLSPESLTFISLIRQLKQLLVFSTLFFVLRNIIESENRKSTRVHFAPFMFLGALLVNTDFLNWALRFFSYLREGF
jgi:Flp pilus assembly protein protease CpaA